MRDRRTARTLHLGGEKSHPASINRRQILPRPAGCQPGTGPPTRPTETGGEPEFLSSMATRAFTSGADA